MNEIAGELGPVFNTGFDTVCVWIRGKKGLQASPRVDDTFLNVEKGCLFLLTAMLKFFEANSSVPEIAGALTTTIETHQRYVLTTHCETPAVLGGDLL